MVFNREEAARRAEASKTNIPYYCQAWTTEMFGGTPVGDVDRDNDADAVDGWKSEPKAKRHSNRNPPRGVPVAWAGGTHGYGHRAVSLGNGKIRSTDAGGRGRVATVDLNWVEKNWGLTYLGWSETIGGVDIPLPPPPPPPTPMTRGVRIDRMINLGRAARKTSKSRHRDRILTAAIRTLRKISRRPK